MGARASRESSVHGGNQPQHAAAAPTSLFSGSGTADGSLATRTIDLQRQRRLLGELRSLPHHELVALLQQLPRDALVSSAIQSASTNPTGVTPRGQGPGGGDMPPPHRRYLEWYAKKSRRQLLPPTQRDSARHFSKAGTASPGTRWVCVSDSGLAAQLEALGMSEEQRKSALARLEMPTLVVTTVPYGLTMYAVHDESMVQEMDLSGRPRDCMMQDTDGQTNVPAKRVCCVEGEYGETLVMWTNIVGSQLTDETRRTINEDGTMQSTMTSALHGCTRQMLHRRE